MTAPTVALSIRQPWADFIVTGQKDIENRDWSTPFRGRIYVHAGKKPDDDLPPIYVARIRPGHLGVLVGEVDIIDCVSESDSPWFNGPYGFVLANAVAYETPIPYRGRLGFFNVNLPVSPDPGT